MTLLAKLDKPRFVTAIVELCIIFILHLTANVDISFHSIGKVVRTRIILLSPLEQLFGKKSNDHLRAIRCVYYTI